MSGKKAARGRSEGPCTPLIGLARRPNRSDVIDNRCRSGVIRGVMGSIVNQSNYLDAGPLADNAPGCFCAGHQSLWCTRPERQCREWCATKWQDNYKNYKDDNDVRGTDPRVLRAALYDDERYVRCASRFGLSPDVRSRYVVFGLCVVPILTLASAPSGPGL